MCLLMVEDGPGVDGVQIVSTVEDVWLEVRCMSRSRLSAGRRRVPSHPSHKQINPLPAEATRLQKHKGTSLS